jgi:hypothetical protein
VRGCDLMPAEVLIGELGKEQTTVKTNITMKKVGAARPTSRTNLHGLVRVSDDQASPVQEDSSSCDAPPIGVIRDKIVPNS